MFWVWSGGSWEALPKRCLSSKDHVRIYPGLPPECVRKGKVVGTALQRGVLRAAACSFFLFFLRSAGSLVYTLGSSGAPLCVEKLSFDRWGVLRHVLRW